jgi:hypothetical protein
MTVEEQIAMEERLEKEAQEAYQREGIELSEALVRLMDNPDFKKVYEYYTVKEVETANMNSFRDVEHRAMWMERMLNRIAFKDFVEETIRLTKPEGI